MKASMYISTISITCRSQEARLSIKGGKMVSSSSAQVELDATTTLKFVWTIRWSS